MIKKLIIATLLFVAIAGSATAFSDHAKSADLAPPGGNAPVADLAPPGGNIVVHA